MTDWESIIAAVQVALGGDRSRGKELLDDCWASADGQDHAKRCVLAHYLADLQDTLDAEIHWDQSALTEYQLAAAGDFAAIGIPSAAALAPSLHLNLGDSYLRRGDLAASRRELVAGLDGAEQLGDDGYSAMIRRGLSGLAERLHERGADTDAASDEQLSRPVGWQPTRH